MTLRKYLLATLFICFSLCGKATGIDTAEAVMINGIKQYITLKGSNDNNPLLLFLHGGPGRSLIPFAEAFTKHLPEKYTVVQWDQRETGETLKLNSTPDSLTEALLKSDTYEMVKYLLHRFGHKKLYLVSHSWGSVMGFDMAQQHPELLYAYIPISPVTDMARSTHYTLNMLKEWARKNENKIAIAELDTIHYPMRTKDDLYYFQKWLFVHNEVDGADSKAFATVFYNWMNVWFNVWIQQSKKSMFKDIPEINCPVYFFAGRGDNQTAAAVTFDYYKRLKAKKKSFTWFEKSGHTIFNSEPEKIEATLLEKVLPETIER